MLRTPLHDGWINGKGIVGKRVYFDGTENIDLQKLLGKMYSDKKFQKKLTKIIGEEGKNDEVLGQIGVWLENTGVLEKKKQRRNNKLRL